MLFALHLHQPVGNFDHVFAEHVHDVYRPLLHALRQRADVRVALHLSGPLLDWSLQHAPAFVDDIGALVRDAQAELLLAGYYEPILAALPRLDRLQQIAWHAEAMHRVFGAPSAAGAGLWLTERVWEPDLARDLADAGISYVLLDDWAWRSAGHAPDTLSRVFRTEHDGRTLDLLPIDESLRYLVPFRPVSEIAQDLRARHARGEGVAVFADDAEKFGGWPGTRTWVLESGWLSAFLETLGALQDEGVITLSHGHELLQRAARGGLAYLPSASYREMEEWALPLDAARHFSQLQARTTAVQTVENRARLRGSHWKHFLVKYPEANRLHKHMLALSALCHDSGNPEAARRAIGMAQSNDPLWHGVFGGLYLPWLRHANWHHLARAERGLRANAPLRAEQRDLDMDGRNEWWIHSANSSVVIAPHRGAAIETWLDLGAAVNITDTLTRRIEPYHLDALSAGEAARRTLNDSASTQTEGAPSIHDLEHALTLDALPPADHAPRVLLQLQAIAPTVSASEYAAAQYAPLRDWSTTEFAGAITQHTDDQLTVYCTSAELDISITVFANGALTWSADWSRAAIPSHALVAVELSHAPLLQLAVTCSDTAAVVPWRYPIESLAKSERGLERTVQGIAHLWRLPATAQRVTFTVALASAEHTDGNVPATAER
jgi:hypothetical protein